MPACFFCQYELLNRGKDYGELDCDELCGAGKRRTRRARCAFCRVGRIFTRHGYEAPYAEQIRCVHDALLQPLAPFLMAQKAGVREWFGMRTRDCHRALNMYRASAAARERLKVMGNIFDIAQGLPEDLSFYRAGQAVFYTVTHEEMAFIAADLAEKGQLAAYR